MTTPHSCFTAKKIFPALLALLAVCCHIPEVGAFTQTPPSRLSRMNASVGYRLASNKKSPIIVAQSQEEGEMDQSSLSSPLSNPALAILDAVALLGFAAVGKASHAPDGSFDIGAVLVTGFPFVISWLLTSPLTGIYQDLQLTKSSSNTADIAKATLIQTAKGWALAVPLGCALRGIIKGYVPPVPFIIVTLIATLVILGSVRLAFALATTPEN